MGSEPNKSEEETETGQALVPVGYANPPAEHRFKKGFSGNPNGRPRGIKRQATLPRSGARAANDILLQEAYRSVSVREGDRVIELPAIQAVFRAMGVSAMKGNRFAQRTLAELVRTVEQEDQALRIENLDAMLTYKMAWEKEIERCKSLGLPDPDPVPHPKDIFLDFRSGETNVRGPMTREERAEWDERLQRRTEAQDEVTYAAAKYKRAKDERTKNMWLDHWSFEQRIFDNINDRVPKHYQVKLENRSYLKDASRPGDFAPDKKANWRGSKTTFKRVAADEEE